jgi:hypothetical protein
VCALCSAWLEIKQARMRAKVDFIHSVALFRYA